MKEHGNFKMFEPLGCHGQNWCWMRWVECIKFLVWYVHLWKGKKSLQPPNYIACLSAKVIPKQRFQCTGLMLGPFTSTKISCMPKISIVTQLLIAHLSSIASKSMSLLKEMKICSICCFYYFLAHRHPMINYDSFKDLFQLQKCLKCFQETLD